MFQHRLAYALSIKLFVGFYSFPKTILMYVNDIPLFLRMIQVIKKPSTQLCVVFNATCFGPSGLS